MGFSGSFVLNVKNIPVEQNQSPNVIDYFLLLLSYILSSILSVLSLLYFIFSLIR